MPGAKKRQPAFVPAGRNCDVQVGESRGSEVSDAWIYSVQGSRKGAAGLENLPQYPCGRSGFLQSMPSSFFCKKKGEFA